MTTAPAPITRVRPRRRWLVFPLGLVVVLVVAFAWAYHRGSTPEAAPRDPASAAERPTSQVFQTAEGNRTVRAAVLIDAPREQVWAAVIDFDNYDQLLPYLKDVTAADQDGGSKKLTGQARSAFVGYWPFSVTVRLDREGKVWSAKWDEQGEGEVRSNRGGWTLEERGTGQTLLVLELETDVKNNPTWLLRNFYLYRLRVVLEAVKSRVESPAKP